MHDGPVSKRVLAAFIVSVLFALASLVYDVKNDSFVVFCDVGQGDASYIPPTRYRYID